MALLDAELRSGEPRRVDAALQALLRPDAASLAPTLAQLLADPRWLSDPASVPTRARAVQRLAAWTPSDAPDTDDDDDTGAAATALLLQLAVDGPVAARVAALGALAGLDVPERLEVAQAAVASDEPRVQRAGVRLLGRLAAGD